VTKNIGILTSGSDSPGMNAAIRAIGKALLNRMNTQLVGFLDGFTGLVKDDQIRLESGGLSGILTHGGTILGTSRDKPQAMLQGEEIKDMTGEAVDTYHRHELDALICIGGRDAQESAYFLSQKGLNVITLPKAIDNDIAGTDVAIGFDSAMEVAARAFDSLHSTAHSLHRIIIVEIMGRCAGWLTLGAGLAGGADVVLIPEIPYDVQKISDAIMRRQQSGKRFSIIAVAEGAMSLDDALFFDHNRKLNDKLRVGEERERVASQLAVIENHHPNNTHLLANRLEAYTGLETRTTILGYLLRGGVPSGVDRNLATQLGTTCVEFIMEKRFGLMLGISAGAVQSVPLVDVIGKHRLVPMGHPWIACAQATGVHLGK
jgi:ATP-dependent phosphofructokinase / diphosphate-dependent phosphofructokinase